MEYTRNMDSALLTRCNENGCRVKECTDRNYTILKGETVEEFIHQGIEGNERACDCVIFLGQLPEEPLDLFLVELKNKSLSPSKVREKFEKTIDIVEDLMSISYQFYGRKQYYCMLFYKSIPPSTFKVLKQTRVISRGKNYAILAGRCGESLKEVMSRYS